MYAVEGRYFARARRQTGEDAANDFTPNPSGSVLLLSDNLLRLEEAQQLIE